MPDIKIVKLKIRRGLDSQRKLVILEQGELGYTTDTERLFIGDGVLSGGAVTGSLVHEVLNTAGARTSLNAYTSDLVYENNLMYQLTGAEAAALTAWGFVGTQVNDSSIEYDGDNKLRIKSNGIVNSMLSAGSVEYDTLNSNVVYASGGIILNSSTGLSANVDNSTIVIDGNYISVADGGITTTQIASAGVGAVNISATVVGPGLSGGNGQRMSAKVDNTTITLNGTDEISVNVIQASNINLGAGFTSSDTELTPSFQTADTDDFSLNGGELSLIDKFDYDNQTFNMPELTISKEGIIIGAFTGTCLPLSTNATNYGGFATQLSGFETNTRVSVVTGAGTAIQTLSSAGFMVLRTGTPRVATGDTRDFERSQYLAVPVFTIPDALVALIDTEVIFMFPWAQNGWRAFDPTETTLSVSELTARACSENPLSATEIDFYSDTRFFINGSSAAATTMSLSSVIYPTLSGWMNVPGYGLFYINANNVAISSIQC